MISERCNGFQNPEKCGKNATFLAFLGLNSWKSIDFHGKWGHFCWKCAIFMTFSRKISDFSWKWKAMHRQKSLIFAVKSLNLWEIERKMRDFVPKWDNFVWFVAKISDFCWYTAFYFLWNLPIGGIFSAEGRAFSALRAGFYPHRGYFFPEGKPFVAP